VRFVGGRFGGTLTGPGMVDGASILSITVQCESCVFETAAANQITIRAEGFSGQKSRWEFTNCVLTASNAGSEGIWTGVNVITDYITINNCVIIAGTNAGTWGITGSNYTSASGHNTVWAALPFKSPSVAQSTDVSLESATDPLPDLYDNYFPESQGNCDLGTGSKTARAIGSYDLYGRPKLGNDDVRGAVYPQVYGAMMLPMQTSTSDSTSLVGLLSPQQGEESIVGGWMEMDMLL